eukprot:IDg15726t1
MLRKFQHIDYFLAITQHIHSDCTGAADRQPTADNRCGLDANAYTTPDTIPIAVRVSVSSGARRYPVSLPRVAGTVADVRRDLPSRVQHGLCLDCNGMSANLFKKQHPNGGIFISL